MNDTITICPAALAIIKRNETCRLKAYRDPGEIWTIGWGHTGREVHPGLIWTQSQADDVFEHDLQLFAKYVKHYVMTPLNPNQLGALVSLSYNAGLIPLKAIGLLLQHNDNIGVAQVMQKHIYDHQGVKRGGLVNRRAEEIALFNQSVDFKSEAV